MNISAVIIAGGKSLRLNGINKSYIVVKGRTIVEWQREAIQGLFPFVFTVAHYPIMPDWPNFEDEFQKIGPIAGIYTALKQAKTDYIFAFSCDMPFLNRQLILAMIKKIKNDSDEVVVPKHFHGIEPLHAIYKKSVLPIIEQQINIQKYQIRAFFDKVKVSYFDIESNGFNNEYFFNINYPEDILKANEYATRIKP
ncbi:MAG: molybdenum cofactor guanylyltransferase [Bacteroidales bacterium]|nr:molybdenum cofactor guanylyltransferase [Bacteroidales bacterium]